MKLNRDEKRELQSKMLLFGYKTYNTDYFNTDSYDNLRISMLRGLPKLNDERLRCRFCPKSEILEDGRYVINKHFSKYDLRVLYTSGCDLETELYAIFGDNPTVEEYDDIINYIINYSAWIKVTDIPLTLNTLVSQNGYINHPRFYDYIKKEAEFYKKLPICVQEINISGDCNENSKMVYVHEMMHALLNRNKGNIKNLLNNEALSIFMERVAALDLDVTENLLDLKILNRLLNIKRNILSREHLKFLERKPLDVLDNNTYIISTLHATALFETYKNGSNRTRNAIENAIGQVISGYETVEDIFERYDATLEKGAKIMQKQIKKFS